MRLVRLIEAHSNELSQGLTEQIRTSERTPDFRTVPAEDLWLAGAEVYRNLGEWLLQKTESDIEARFRIVGARRAADGVRLHQVVWALMLSREHLWHFLRHHSFSDNVVALCGELELQRLLNQFFDRAIYYAVLGYEEAARSIPKGDLERARDIAVSIGLISDRAHDASEFEDQNLWFSSPRPTASPGSVISTVTLTWPCEGLDGTVRNPACQSSFRQPQLPAPEVARKNCRKRPLKRRRPPFSQLGQRSAWSVLPFV